MQIIPMRDLKNNVEVERRCSGEDSSVYVMKCERNIQALYEAKTVMKGLDDVKVARTVDGDVVINNIKNKYGI